MVEDLPVSSLIPLRKPAEKQFLVMLILSSRKQSMEMISNESRKKDVIYISLIGFVRK